MIITCPYCRLNGERKNLAEVLPDGVKVIRSMNGSIDFTLIKAQEYTLGCGACGNTVIYKKPKTFLPQVNILMTWGTMLHHYET